MPGRGSPRDILADWPCIQARHLAGDSLADIARDYGCSVRLIETIIDKKPMREVRGFTLEGPRRYDLNQPLKRHTAEAISKFLSSFDDLLTKDTPKNNQKLRSATDVLLRAAARVRLALELKRE
jgi:hypothetical protein